MCVCVLHLSPHSTFNGMRNISFSCWNINFDSAAEIKLINFHYVVRFSLFPPCMLIPQIAWLKVDTQTILSIQTHIITKNHRMTVSHVENRAWVLRIRDVKESDKGWYMCQINTDPMKNQVGYLNVVGE